MIEIKFKHGDDVLTLWPEKRLGDDGWLGWCPERGNNMFVNAKNVVEETTLADVTDHV